MSFPLHPVLRHAQETMTFVFSVISKLDGAKILTLPLDDLVTFSDDCGCNIETSIASQKKM